MDSLLKIASNNNNPKAAVASSSSTTTTTTGSSRSRTTNTITTTSGRTPDDDAHVPSLYNDNDLLVIDASIKPLVPGLLDNLDAPGTTTTTTVTNHGLSK
jgi:hypothetical protein